jgi:sugar fermentation stimulation protein A
MIYPNIIAGRFIRRHNRFTADVSIDGKVETVHVKNTGRCRELLLPDAEVFLTKSDNSARKTCYDLVAVKKLRDNQEPLLINMDSQIPNDAAAEWLPESGLFSSRAVIRREVCYGKSRFDFFVQDGERKVFIEVKGVTLEKDSAAFFPDAPTERGVKHLEELTALIQDEYEAVVLFVIQMKSITAFRPCDEIDPEFGNALRRAAAAGVKVMAMDCVITSGSIKIDSPVKVEL